MAASPNLPRTHEVSNQPPPLENWNPFLANRALAEALQREGAGWARASLESLGAEAGTAEMSERAILANRNVPVLRSFDRFGNRRDEIDYHPAWHELVAFFRRHGVDVGCWSDARPGAHVARAARYLVYGEIENGTQCPATVNYAAVPVLRRNADVARDWLPLLFSRDYDPRFIPISGKRSAMMGMAMTEKQGGSDVRANTSRAEPSGGNGEYRIIGHKWFCSIPMSDAFLMTAQAPGGLTCFLMPRFTPDGARNEIRIQRLKDKLGDRSNASSEVEYEGAWALRIGEEGRGVATILEMVNYTRLDCALGTTSQMRAALSNALHHSAHRASFGRRLADHALMQNVLADMALETEAATALGMRLARTRDAPDDESESLVWRILTPAAKYWVCKRGPALGAEAMEVLGGNGFVEEAPVARIYRQLPLNSIWEGPGNVMCLDVLRALEKTPRAFDALVALWHPASGRNRVFDDYVSRIKRDRNDASSGRRFTQQLALATQAALLIDHAPDFVSAAFCASRLKSDWGAAFGTLPRDCDVTSILERAWPGIDAAVA